MLAGLALATVGLTTAQTPAASKDKGELFTATSESVTGAKDSIRIELRRWSADADRDQVISAWTKAAAPHAPAGGAPAADAGRGGRGRGGRRPPARLTPEAALAVALVAIHLSLGTLWSSETTGYSIHYATHAPAPDGSDVVTLVTDLPSRLQQYLVEAGWRPAITLRFFCNRAAYQR